MVDLEAEYRFGILSNGLLGELYLVICNLMQNIQAISLKQSIRDMEQACGLNSINFLKPMFVSIGVMACTALAVYS